MPSPFVPRCAWAVGVAALVAAAAGAQEPRHWPLAKISFPVDTDKIASLDPRPVKLRFYAAPPRGRFDLVAERAVGELDELVDPTGNKPSRRGFHYTARADGPEEFALQYVFADGSTQPAANSLAAQYRIVFDTRPPVVRITTPTALGVSWTVEDENLVADSVRLEVKYADMAEWMPVGTRSFSARDAYSWKEIKPGKVLEVRVTAKDKAGHEGRSAIVRLPTTATGGSLPEPAFPPRTGTGFGNPDDFGAPASRPQIEYVNTNKLTVRGKFTKVTRSGIKEAVLWVRDGQGGWKEAARKPVAIGPNDKEPGVDMPYDAARDGLYGFIVLPVNGAGGKPDDPRDGDSPQWLVEVDTTKPSVEVKGVKVGPGGLNGPRVEVEWVATDKNLMPEPITLEYATDQNAKDWLPMTGGKVSNSGRYIWEVDDKQLWKFYVRATAVDKAGNSDRTVYKDAVMVDLEKPAATIEKVNGNGAPSVRNYAPDPPGAPSAPAAPPAPPASNTPKKEPPKPQPKMPEPKKAEPPVATATPPVAPPPAAAPTLPPGIPEIALPPATGGPAMPPLPAPGGK